MMLRPSICRHFAWHRLAVLASAVTFWLGIASTGGADEPPADPSDKTVVAAKPDALWTDHVEPILKKNCFGCHGSVKQKGGLDLSSLQAMLVGGTDGAVVIPGRSSESPLLARVQADGDDRMPPEKDRHLSADDIMKLTQWIDSLGMRDTTTAGNKDWSYQVPTLMDLATRTQWTPPTEMPTSTAIDYLIEAAWQAKQLNGSGLCDDLTFVRRIYLDLAGRIPTEIETAAFVKSSAEFKRAELVDRLLAGNDYPRHMAELFDVVLLARKGKAVAAQRQSNGWLDYLERSFAANRPWNMIVKDLIVARPTAETKGAQWFLYEQKNNHQQMAEAIAPVAFGVMIDCAQCHNHPLAHEIKQSHYWGLVTAFNRTSNADTKDGPALSEAATGGFVNFTNLKKESQPAVISLLNNKQIEEARPADGTKEEDADDNYLVKPDRNSKRPQRAAVPKFSRREAVAEAIVSENPLLARAQVNRVWAMLMGRGLVQPVNEMDSRHAPSHPELLAWLARDFESSGFDVKRLVRNIVLSRAYQHWAFRGEQSPPPPELFACHLEQPLSAEVLYRSLLTATGNPADNTDELRQALVDNFPATIAVEYNATLQQMAFLTNSPLIDQLLKPNGTNLSARLIDLPNSLEQVHCAFTAILGRAPDAAELAESVAYLKQRADRSEAALRHLQWALLTSPEFLLNH